MSGELNASQTRSLPLPVLYSSTPNANRLSRQIHTPIEGSDFANLLSCLRLFVQSRVATFPQAKESGRVPYLAALPVFFAWR
jgi:hypothetical protein